MNPAVVLPVTAYVWRGIAWFGGETSRLNQHARTFRVPRGRGETRTRNTDRPRQRTTGYGQSPLPFELPSRAIELLYGRTARATGVAGTNYNQRALVLRRPAVGEAGFKPAIAWAATPRCRVCQFRHSPRYSVVRCGLREGIEPSTLPFSPPTGIPRLVEDLGFGPCRKHGSRMLSSWSSAGLNHRTASSVAGVGLEPTTSDHRRLRIRPIATATRYSSSELPSWDRWRIARTLYPFAVSRRKLPHSLHRSLCLVV